MQTLLTFLDWLTGERYWRELRESGKLEALYLGGLSYARYRPFDRQLAPVIPIRPRVARGQRFRYNRRPTLTRIA